jgi:hypothetical protein
MIKSNTPKNIKAKAIVEYKVDFCEVSTNKMKQVSCEI